MSIRFDFSYNNRDDNGDDIFSININFENPKSSHEIAQNMQKFLDAIGHSNIYVEVQTAQERDNNLDDDIPF